MTIKKIILTGVLFLSIGNAFATDKNIDKKELDKKACKYVQERIELQILKLPADKMREAYLKITERQDADLKAGLPLEKYEAFVQMQKDGVAKMRKEQKKAEKKKKKKKKKSKE